MAWWVHKRGHFGSKASAVLRSVYPISLGVGGWLLGALIVLATMPSVPVDDELLVALSAGLPVGLGIYLAWVHRDWATQKKGLGVAAAVAGALVGAWLGFHATAGLIALVTAILGAIAGGNLLLILLDIVRAGSSDDEVDSGAAADTVSVDVRPEAPTGAVMRWRPFAHQDQRTSQPLWRLAGSLVRCRRSTISSQPRRNVRASSVIVSRVRRSERP
jgi:hypothetical protein